MYQKFELILQKYKLPKYLVINRLLKSNIIINEFDDNLIKYDFQIRLRIFDDNYKNLKNTDRDKIINKLFYFIIIESKDSHIFLNNLKSELKGKNNIKKENKRKLYYDNIIYNTKELELFNSYKLNKEQENKLLELKQIVKNRVYENIIKEIYIMYLNNYSPKEIGRVYGKSARCFELLLKECGLNRNRYEAQAIAKTKRNYKEIHLKVRETLIKNQTNIKGSKPENYLRQLLNVKLPMAFPDCEIIVGLNNKSILDDGKEVDIPVLIIHNSQILKIAIKYNRSLLS